MNTHPTSAPTPTTVHESAFRLAFGPGLQFVGPSDYTLRVMGSAFANQSAVRRA